MITLKNVMVATDFGEASDTALNYGRALARSFGANLHVVHVVENVFLRAGHGELGAVDVVSLQRDLEESARVQLETVVREDDRRELGAKPVLITSSSASLGIITYAKEAGVDIIVMGTHGRGTFAHMLMGSVAERVVRTAPCPVLTVHSRQHDFVAPDALQMVSHT